MDRGRIRRVTARDELPADTGAAPASAKPTRSRSAVSVTLRVATGLACGLGKG